MRPEYLGLFVAYLALILGAGLVFARRMKSLEDFFLASRRLGGGLVFASLTASWFGATSILVTADEALVTGVRALWVVGLPAVATVLLLASVFAGRLHRLPVLTWSDLVEWRYGRTVRRLTSGLLVWYMTLLAASQMTALGAFLSSFLGMPFLTGLAIGTAVVLAYSIVGGLRSVVLTDIVQLVLLAAGVGALFAFAAGRATWAEAAAAAVRTGRTGYFDLFGGFGTNFWIFLSFTLAWTISPIALQRIRAARSEKAARRGLWATAAALALLYVLVVGLGVLSLPAFPEGTGGRPLAAVLAGGAGGFFPGGLVFVAILAAILSTMDTALNAGALVLSRDILLRAFPAAAMRPVAWSRAATILVGGAAVLVASRFQDILKTIGLSAEILAEGFFIPGAAMIFLKARRPKAGLFALLLGGGFAVLTFLESAGILRLGLPTWPRSVPLGLALSALGYLAGTLADLRAFPSRRLWAKMRGDDPKGTLPPLAHPPSGQGPDLDVDESLPLDRHGRRPL